MPGTDETVVSTGPTVASSGDVLVPGDVLAGRYVVDRLVGTGGMGSVYAARDRVLERPVAIKVLRAELRRNDELVSRFLNEARIVASLFTNPNIVSIFDLGRTDSGDPYLVMELLRGKSLRDTIEVGSHMRPSRTWVLEVSRQIAGALVDAHASGVAHRDLKPENAFVLDTHMRIIKVLDFGLAVSSNAPLAEPYKTRPGDLIGTPMYMSPEAIRGDRVGAPADLYALGILVYELATNGQMPYDARTLGQWMRAHELDAPRPFPDVHPSGQAYTRYPKRFHDLLAKLLAKDPAERPTARTAYRDFVLAAEDIDARNA